MLITVASSLYVVDFIEPYLILDQDCPSNEVFKNTLKRMLIDDRSNIFIIVAFDNIKDEPDPQLFAFMVAATAEEFTHVIISQAWCRPESPPKLMDTLYNRVQIWARNKNKTSLTMETRRDPRAFTRRWGFEPVSTLMERKLTSSQEELLINKLTHKEVIGDQNGKVEQTTDSERPKQSPETSGCVVEPAASVEIGVGSGSDTVQGADSSEPDAGISEVTGTA